MNDSILKRRRARGFKAGARVIADAARLLRARWQTGQRVLLSRRAEAPQGLRRLHTTSRWPAAFSPGVLCSCSSSFLSYSEYGFFLAAAAQSWLSYQNQSWALTFSKARKNFNRVLGKFCLSFRWPVIYLGIVKLYRKRRSSLTENLHCFT